MNTNQVHLLNGTLSLKRLSRRQNPLIDRPQPGATAPSGGRAAVYTLNLSRFLLHRDIWGLGGELEGRFTPHRIGEFIFNEVEHVASSL